MYIPYVYYILIYQYMMMCIYIYLYHICIYIYVNRVYIYTFIHTYICILYAYMYVYRYVCMCVYIHTYMSTDTAHTGAGKARLPSVLLHSTVRTHSRPLIPGDVAFLDTGSNARHCHGVVISCFHPRASCSAESRPLSWSCTYAGIHMIGCYPVH